MQGSIEGAIATIMQLSEPTRLTCAGRTDAGVHARGQVAHVDLDGIEAEQLKQRLRRILPIDIQIRSVAPAPLGFDARFSALERHYVYRINDESAGPDPLVRRHVVWNRRPLNAERMNDAAAHLLGEHDFAAFCKARDGATTIRTLKELTSRRTPEGILETSIRADAFCHSMVRSIMGALTAVGDGRYAADWVRRVLTAKVRDPHVLVMPALGLTLEQVEYPPDTFMAQRASETRSRREQPN